MTKTAVKRVCAYGPCHNEIASKNPAKQYCSEVCRMRASLKRIGKEGPKPGDDELSLEIRISRPDSATLLLELTGQANIWTAPELKEEILASLDEATIAIFDFSGLTFIDSTVLGVLVSIVKRLRPRQGQVKIVCTDENINRIFEITGLERVFEMCTTQSQALGG